MASLYPRSVTVLAMLEQYVFNSYFLDKVIVVIKKNCQIKEGTSKFLEAAGKHPS